MSRSLGVLTLDLVAKTGGFESGMDQASRIADKKTRQIEAQARARAKAIEEAFSSMASAVAGPLSAAFSVAGLAEFTAQTIRTAKEIKDLAALAGTSTTEFQKMAYGAQQVGISGDKLADILKDVQDKTGEFLNTGGGPLKDFFTIIAPKIGLTAKAFENLSGPQALQLFYKSLEQANLSQSEMVFYLEAIANDSTKLQPLLRNNAEGFKAAGDEAERYGLMSDDLIKASAELTHQWDGLSRQVQGAFLPAITDLVRLLNEDLVPALSGPVIKGALNDFSAFARSTVQEIKGLIEIAARFKQMFQVAHGTIQPEGSWGPPQLPELPPVVSTGAPIRATPKPTKAAAPKSAAPKDDYIPLADAARAYERALDALNRIQLQATTSGLELNRSQTALLDVMASPEWLQMPETWRLAIAGAGEYAIAAEQAAESQARINEVLASLPRNLTLADSLFEALQRNTMSTVELLELGLGGALDSVSDGFVQMATTGKLSVRDMVADMLVYLSKLLAHQAFMMLAQLALNAFTASKPFGNYSLASGNNLPSMGGGTGLSSGGGSVGLKFNALGDTYPGGIKPFAAGGVVNSPTLFKFADGGNFRTGVMGEAGPEAIIPLKRGKDGKLGVAMQGGGGTSVIQNFNINVEGGDEASGKKQGEAISKELRGQMKTAVLEVMMDQKRPGGLLA